MIKITKIVHFEMAHAIYGYDGRCKDIHGHSYELHVTVTGRDTADTYIPAPGFVVDFKELKRLVYNHIADILDHHLVLSEEYLKSNPEVSALEHLLVWKNEPTAENILYYIKDKLGDVLPDHIRLRQLKLYETKDSYAEWVTDNG